MSRHRCLFLHVSFSGFIFFDSVTEYTISDDKRVQKRDSDLCSDEVRSIIVLALLCVKTPQKKKKKKLMWIGTCSSLSVLRLQHLTSGVLSDFIPVTS